MEPKIIDLKNCQVAIYDGSDPIKFIEMVKIDEGTIQWTVARDVQVKLDKGQIDYLKTGDEQPLKVQMECRFSNIKRSSGDPYTPFEILTNADSAFVSVNTDCSAYAVHIEVLHTPDCGVDVESELFRFESFTY
jgi:hypothetical protein